MKTEKNILLAFMLNISFSIFEFIGGLFTNSVSILSDAIHDLGDALSIGVSYFLEKKSKLPADNKHTYGYLRYSVLGGVITTIILIIGSIFVIYHAIGRLLNPVDVNYSGMLFLAIIGVILNSLAAFFTKDGDSVNQKAVNLHMLEDVLGWVIVLIGSIIMNFTNLKIIDPIMSIGVALFIFINAIKNLKNILDIFLEKAPDNIDVDELKKHLLSLNGVVDIHHIHVWSMDGVNNCATMHLVVDKENDVEIKKKIKKEFKDYSINHVIIETEEKECSNLECEVKNNHKHHHHH